MTPAALIAALPASIRVGPFDIALIVEAMHEAALDRRAGNFSAWKLEMRVRADAPSKLDALDTLLHEVSHAIWFAYGIRDADDQERTVAVMGTAWVQVYRDNPWILEWIGEATAS